MLRVLRKAIEESDKGAIPYSTYIELVLYHPEHGYYMKRKEKVGRSGDFFTSSNVSSVYAKQFARLFIRLVEDSIVPPVICEIGGGTGRFARDMLEEWKARSPETFAKLRYILIEASPYHRSLQRDLLHSFPIIQYASLLEMNDLFEGIVFSNELFDAFPVAVIEKKNGELYEVYVSCEQETLQEVLYPLHNERIAAYLEKHGLSLREGQRFEVPLVMGDYIAALSRHLKQALIVTVDYGYSNAQWMHPAHRRGSLRGYCRHQLIHDVLQHPGDMDVTTHIHWDELKRTGEANGLQTVLHTSQRAFLLAAGILEQLMEHHDPNPFSEASRQNRAVRSLVLNGGMSDSFQVYIQQKGLQDFQIRSYMDVSFLRM